MKLRVFMIGAMLAAIVVAPPTASAQVWRGGYGGGNQVSGVVASVQGSSLTMQNGLTVFLHQGTVINPTGTTLAPGMAISVYGVPGGNNAINANQVNVNGSAYNQGYGYGNLYGYQNTGPYEYPGGYYGGPVYSAPPAYYGPPVYNQPYGGNYYGRRDDDHRYDDDRRSWDESQLRRAAE